MHNWAVSVAERPAGRLDSIGSADFNDVRIHCALRSQVFDDVQLRYSFLTVVIDGKCTRFMHDETAHRAVLFAIKNHNTQ